MPDKICFIGAGRLGTTLALALQADSEFELSGYCTASPQQQIRIRQKLSVGVVSPVPTEELVRKSDVVFITVQDERIAQVAKQLATMKVPLAGKIVLHCSGALSSEELTPLSARGARCASLHPMQTFSSTFAAPSVFRKVFFSAEGEDAALRFCRKIVKSVDGLFMKMETANRPVYHLGATITSNFLIALLDMAATAFRKAGIEEDKIPPVMQPMLNAAISNFFEKGTTDALTGPARRGDADIIKRHLAVMETQTPRLLPVYKQMTRYLIDVLTTGKTKSRQHILEILDED